MSGAVAWALLPAGASSVQSLIRFCPKHAFPLKWAIMFDERLAKMSRHYEAATAIDRGE